MGVAELVDVGAQLRGLTEGSELFWAAHLDVLDGTCDGAAPRAELGGLQLLDAGGRALFTASLAGYGYRLCCRRLADNAFALDAQLLLDVFEVASLSGRSYASRGVPTDIRFSGTGVSTGDAAKWLRAGGEDCATPADDALGGEQLLSGARATFAFEQLAPGLVLCYAFAGEPYRLYANLTLDVLGLGEPPIGAPALDGAGDVALRAVAGVAARLQLNGVGLSVADSAKWVRADAANCAAAADVALGGEQRPLAADMAMLFAMQAGARGLRLCYRLRTEPFALYSAWVADALAVSSPVRTIALAGFAQRVTFAGVGVRAGDRARWVRAGAAGCAESAAAEAVVSEGGVAIFTFATPALGMALCYRFGNESDAPFAPFGAVRADALGVTSPSRPSAAVVGAAEVLALDGVGLEASDLAFWAARGADCATASADGAYGGLLNVSASLSIAFTIQLPAPAGLVLCYRFARRGGAFAQVLDVSLVALATYLVSGPALTTAVAGVRAPIALQGLGLGVGATDSAAWLAPNASLPEADALRALQAACTAGEIDAALGGEVRIAQGGAVGLFAPTAPTPAGLARLCYKFSGKPRALWPAVQLRVLGISSPARSVAVRDAPKLLTLRGVGLATGDRAQWLPASAGACNDALAEVRAGLGGVQPVTVGADGLARARFLFERTSASAGIAGLQLCYAFGDRPFAPFAGVRLSVFGLSGPIASTLVASVPETIAFVGHGVGAGDTAAWVDAAAADCADAAAFGVPVGADGTARFAFDEGALGLRLCYAFAGEPFALHANLTLDVLQVREPLDSLALARAAAAEEIAFAGVGVRAGDVARWVAVDAAGGASCAQAGDAGAVGFVGPAAQLSANMTAAFAFDSAVRDARLCYRHAGAEEAFVLYTAIRLVVAEVQGPARTVAVAGTREPLVFSGVGLASGDSALWVVSAAECTDVAGGPIALAAFGGLLAVGAASAAPFRPTARQLGLSLCYRFRTKPYAHYPAITLDVLGLVALVTPNAPVGSVGESMEVGFDGVGVANGDRAYWAPRGTTSCAAVPPLAMLGGLQTVTSARASFEMRRGAGGIGYALCYAFGAEPFVAYPALSIDVLEVTGPLASVAVRAEPFALTFTGVGVGAGDEAVWVGGSAPEAAAACAAASAGSTVGGGARAVVQAGGGASFSIGEVSAGLRLCYRFARAGSAVAFRLVDSVSLSATLPSDPFASATITRLVPTGAALGRATSVTVFGSGFGAQAIAKVAILRCALGSGERVPVVSVSVGQIVCALPALLTVGAMPLSLVAEELSDVTGLPREPIVVSNDFAVYDSALIFASAIAPAGVPQGAAGALVTVRGGGLVDYGALAVRFKLASGDRDVSATMPDQGGGEVVCAAPVVSPNEQSPQAVPIEVALDGQAFVPTGLALTFYTAAVRTGVPLGAPLGAQSALTLTGSGFVDLPGGPSCVYAAADGSAVISVGAAFVSASSVVCSAPGAATASDGAYTVSLSLNRLDLVPAFFESASFYLYDARLITVAALSPPGGPVTGGTALTLTGTGFRALGAGQLCCSFGRACRCDAPATLLAPVGGATRARCVTPARASGRAGAVGVELTLSGGLDGSFSSSGRTFYYYRQPTVTAISPPEGSADGGTITTIVGSGFERLAGAAGVADGASVAALRALLRVRFGPVVAGPPVSVSDTLIVQEAAWGAEGPVRVTVALNGVQFAPADGASAPLFTLRGLHSPEIVLAAFSPQATQLLVHFDPQPTDRARMFGAQPCARVLDDATVARLRGSSASAPICFWRSDTLLLAQLNALTALRPGDTIGVRPGALGPANLASSCTAALCAASSARIDIDEACGAASCAQPVAALSGPRQISNCPRSTLRLDASASFAAGIALPSYAWRVDPGRSDDAPALNARLRALDGPGAALLEIDLSVGSSFVFLLQVTSFLGVRSDVLEWAVTRNGLAAPSLEIDGPSELVARPSATLLLQGRAELASCWTLDDATILFAWELLATEDAVAGSGDAARAPVPVLGETSLPALSLPPLTLSVGVVYTFQLSARMAADPTATLSTAAARVSVAAQPLVPRIAGGDRTVSSRAPFEIDASASFDPNELDDASSSVDSGLVFSWALARVTDELVGSAEPIALPTGVDGSARALALGAGSLPADLYVASLTLSKPSSQFGLAPASAAVRVRVVPADVPSILIEPLTAIKLNPTWSRPVDALRIVTSLDARAEADAAAGLVQWSYAWRAFTAVGGSDGQGALARVDASLDLADDAAVTVTGASGPNLVLRSGVLTASALYVFELTVSGAGQSATASVEVVVNRPPYGGQLVVAPLSGGVALHTLFHMSASAWTDDTEDLPLLYLFDARLPGAPFAQPLRERQLSSNTRTYLPAGEIELGVTVSDFYGAAASEARVVQVDAPAHVDCETVRGALDAASTAVLIGNAGRANQLLAAIAALGGNTTNCSAGDGGSAALLGRRLQANGTSADAGVVERMLLVSASAASSSASTPISRKQSASVLFTILDAGLASGGGAGLSGGAQAAGLGQLASLVNASREDGVDEATAASVIGALDAALGSAASGLNEAEAASVADGATGAAKGLAASLLSGTASGEGSSALGAGVNVSAARATVAQIAASNVGAPGTTGGVSLPAAILNGQPAGVVDDGVDVVLYAFERNVLGEPTAQAAGAGAPPTADGGAVRLGPLQTAVFTVALLPAGDASELDISGLSQPLLVSIPLAPQPPNEAQPGAAGDCREYNFCSGRGACVQGACACAPRFSGANCALVPQCRFWDEALGVWSMRGCRTVAPPSGAEDGLLWCACTHLTSFGGVTVPSSLAEAQADAEAVRVNTFSGEQFVAAITDFDFDENPYVYSLVLALAAANCASMLAFCARDRYERRQVAKRREARARALLKEVGSASDELKVRIDTLAEQDKARAERAVIAVQRHVRGALARRRSHAQLGVGVGGSGGSAAPRRLKARTEQTLAWLRRQVITAVESEHTVLGLWFGDADGVHRAELCQTFWCLVMLGLVIECMLYQPTSGSASVGVDEQAPRPLVSINVVQLLIVAAITSALCIPAVVLFKLVFTLGCARRAQRARPRWRLHAEGRARACADTHCAHAPCGAGARHSYGRNVPVVARFFSAIDVDGQEDAVLNELKRREAVRRASLDAGLTDAAARRVSSRARSRAAAKYLSLIHI